MSDDAPDKDSKSGADHDVVLLHSRTEDGEGMRAIRSRPEKLELAEIRPLKKGKPLASGEIIRLQPREESPLIFDVKVQYDGRPAQDMCHSGPPRYSSARYCENWEAVFGKRKRGAGAGGKPN